MNQKSNIRQLKPEINSYDVPISDFVSDNDFSLEAFMETKYAQNVTIVSDEDRISTYSSTQTYINIDVLFSIPAYQEIYMVPNAFNKFKDNWITYVGLIIPGFFIINQVIVYATRSFIFNTRCHDDYDAIVKKIE